MIIREQLEQYEQQNLSQYACLSKNTQGREIKEQECNYRTCFMRDRDRILHSKSFRRLKHKTQVFLLPEGDHFRTRLTHTLEVSQIARTLARALRLNEDLTEAIALGHDLGHTPFGHMGEASLNKLVPNGFEHCKQSVRIVEKVEKNGKGLNLTKEVRDGILNHRTAGKPMTMEGKCVRIADKIAYVNHDMDDAINARILKEDDIPVEIKKVLGNTVRERYNTLVVTTIEASIGKNEIMVKRDVLDAMKELKTWLFTNLYKGEVVKHEEEKAMHIVESLFYYYKEHVDSLPGEYKELISSGEDEITVVVDYISGMTDDYARYKFQELYVPKGWSFN